MPETPAASTRVSVVIPVHNESGYLEDALAAILGEMEGVPARVEVVLAENGSTDGTAELADRLAAAHDTVTAIHLSEANYGAAMRAGFLRAGGEWSALFDIDYYSGLFLADALSVADRADLVLASKRAPGASDQRSAFRRFATRVFNLLLRVLFRSRVSDTHGMKAIRATVVADLVPAVRSTKDLFDTELVLRAERAGYRIVEVPASVEEVRATSQSFLKRVPRTLAGLVRIRLRFWREGRRR